MIGYFVVVVAFISASYITWCYIKQEDTKSERYFYIYLIAVTILLVTLVKLGYTVVSVALLAVLLLMSFTDITSGYILDGVVICGILIEIAQLRLDPLYVSLTAMILMFVYFRLEDMPFLGAGDIEVFFIILLIKGFWFLACTACLASLIALVFILVKAVLTRQLPKQFPFVPYIAFAYAILMFTGGHLYVVNYLLG